MVVAPGVEGCHVFAGHWPSRVLIVYTMRKIVSNAPRDPIPWCNLRSRQLQILSALRGPAGGDGL